MTINESTLVIIEWALLALVAVGAAWGTRKVIRQSSLSVSSHPRLAASGPGAVFVLVLLGGYVLMSREPTPADPAAAPTSTAAAAPDAGPSVSIETRGDQSPAIIGGGDVTVTVD